MNLNFLKSDSSESSLRVNMFMVTVPIALILLSVAIFIGFRTFSPIEVVVDGHKMMKYTYQEMKWFEMGAFVAAIIGALLSLWWGKKINKEIEISKPENPVQPNANSQNLPQ